VTVPRKSDLLRNTLVPRVFGYELDRGTLTPVRRAIDMTSPGDHGADPLGNGSFRMIPSGDIVDLAERNRRLSLRKG